ncbi:MULTISPECIES: hypothetical protein [Bacillus cereus group]|uniref:hypothetical protein n=1 Tax=Bacillus cereus group TaxID=86661 RepID=UPI0005E14DA5|nr:MULTISPECIES: hypothetical protein [Bacillus cereus group]WIV92096.1 hypothetical protein QNH49_22540 [Bacillus bombysepticus]CGG58271.1 Uncharacterised protein [Streptococcus pneumoniae]MDA2087833.1 hypothetical protein [Bacillus cereus]MDA2403476.1 hypothetical protein [Bacillus cereus]MDA2423986.1 hypothetical protein [Bacillus cereus]
MHSLERLLEAQSQIMKLHIDGLMSDDAFSEMSSYIEGLIEGVYEEEKEAHKESAH